MSHTVTVGFDGTPGSTAAAEWAAQEAWRRGASLDVVRVTSAEEALEAAGITHDALHGWSAQSTGALADSLAEANPRLTVRHRTLAGDAAEVLTDRSATSELLVVGSRRLSAFRGFLVGSVAQPTVAHARCPVVLVRADVWRGAPVVSVGPESKEGDEWAGSVVLGVDVHAACEETLAFAFEAAERRSASLKVLNAWEPPPTYGPRPMVLPGGAIDGVLAEQAGALAKRVRPWDEKYPGVRVGARAVLAQPAELLLDASQDAALLVVGRRRRDASVGAHVGPVTHAAMQHAHAPVAVVPHS